MKQEALKVPVTPDLSSLHKSQIFYMERVQRENFDRVLQLKKIRRSNLISGFGLAGTVIGIYIMKDIHLDDIITRAAALPRPADDKDMYSIFSVKQENFLDELDEKKM